MVVGLSSVRWIRVLVAAAATLVVHVALAAGTILVYTLLPITYGGAIAKYVDAPVAA